MEQNFERNNKYFMLDAQNKERGAVTDMQKKVTLPNYYHWEED